MFISLGTLGCTGRGEDEQMENLRRGFGDNVAFLGDFGEIDLLSSVNRVPGDPG